MAPSRSSAPRGSQILRYQPQGFPGAIFNTAACRLVGLIRSVCTLRLLSYFVQHLVIPCRAEFNNYKPSFNESPPQYYETDLISSLEITFLFLIGEIHTTRGSIETMRQVLVPAFGGHRWLGYGFGSVHPFANAHRSIRRSANETRER